MGKPLRRGAWARLVCRVIALAGVAGVASEQAAATPAPDVLAARAALEARVETIRRALADASQKEPHEIEQVAQWWGNWPNWPNWGNWANWLNR